MVVAFTSNIGLAKPDETEMAKNWAVSTELQEDNNLIIIDQMDLVLTSYTPVLSAQTTPPNTGTTGTLLGEYQDLQGMIQGHFLITFGGTGITSGSGEYGISLPAVADNVFHTVGTAFNGAAGPNSVVGEGFVYDSSAAATSGHVALDLVTVGGVSYLRMLTPAHTVPAKTSRLFTNSMPFAMADQDRFIGNFCYKKL